MDSELAISCSSHVQHEQQRNIKKGTHKIIKLKVKGSHQTPQHALKKTSKLCDAAVQVGVVSYKQEQAIRKFELENVMFSEQNNLLEKQIQQHKTNYQSLNEIVSSMEFKQLELVQKSAYEGNKKAIFLMDQLKNFQKRQPSWSETSLEQCEKWRLASGKDYTFVKNKNILSCPSRSSLEKFAKGKESKNGKSGMEDWPITEVTIEIRQI